MAIPVIMPRQGQSVETCIITRWYKAKGDRVSAGDLLFSYETDKAAFEMESPADGILLDIFFDEGSDVPVLTNVAALGSAGEDSTSLYPGIKDHAEAASAVTGERSSGIKKEHGAAIPPNGETRIRISPRARIMAEKKGLDYSGIKGSGPGGRIVLSDIEDADSGKTVPGKAEAVSGREYNDQPLSNIRKMISKTMLSSLQNSAQLTHHMSADARNILEARSKIKKGILAGTGKHDITLNDIICRCVIKALQKFPEVNSHFLGESIRTFSDVHLGIAVDTERGLMVPAVKNAGSLDLTELSGKLKTVAESCRKGNIDPELIQSTAATFTVSNLGNYGVEMFTPVINLPQVAILGVCAIVNRPADLGNKTFGFVPYIGLSLTYDHRAIDGGPATLFLREIKQQIENFVY